MIKLQKGQIRSELKKAHVAFESLAMRRLLRGLSGQERRSEPSAARGAGWGARSGVGGARPVRAVV